MIDLSDWDQLVTETYGRPYSFQQQGGCKSRGTFNLCIPDNCYDDSGWNDSVPEVINGREMGVKFDSWLQRDPAQKLKDQTANFELELWWTRNFYPDVQAVANDLHKKGLLEAGEYTIDIDW